MNITWDAFQSYLVIDRKLSAKPVNLSGIYSRFKILSAYFKDKPITRENFNLFILDLKTRGKKNAYLNNFIKVAKHLDRYLDLNILQDYTYFKEDRRAIDILEPHEIQKMIDLNVDYYRNTKETNLKYHCLISFLAYTGCRISEVLNLTWNDLHTEYAILRATKNGEDRIVPLPTKLAEECLKLPKIGNFVFSSKRGKTLNIEVVSMELKRRAKLANIHKPVYNHLLRHSFITTLLTQGVDPIIVGRIVGHTDINSTKRYDHRDINKLREYQMMHPLLKKELDVIEITRSVREHLEKLIDKTKYTLDIHESSSKLLISVEKVYA